MDPSITGRLVLQTLALTCAIFGAAGTGARAAPGDLDEDFGDRGSRAIVEPAHPGALAGRPDGTLLVAGNGGVNGQGFGSVTAYTGGGSVDRSFGSGGTVTLGFGGVSSTADDLVVAPDGSIVVVGSIKLQQGEGYRGMVVRLLADGSLDPSFGFGGSVIDAKLDLSPTFVTLDSAGRILVGGGRLVSRLLTDGSFDTSFSGDGVADVTPLVITALAVERSGSVVVGGYSTNYDPNREALRLIRLLEDGEVDPGFGTDGMVDFRATQGYQRLVSLGVDHDGRFVVGAEGCTGFQLGPGGGGGSCETSALRFLPDGQVDTSFGASGRLDQSAGAVVGLDREGRILLGGADSPGRNYPEAFAVSRLDGGGAHDLGFGTAGTAYAYDDLRGGVVSELAPSPDGTITVLGLGQLGTGRLLRFEVAPEIDDADADRLVDEFDRCDLFAGSAGRGCPPIERTAALSFTRTRKPRLQVTVDAPLAACEKKEQVLLKRKRPGPDEVVRRALVDSLFGPRVRFRRPFPAGRYYARLRTHFNPGFGYCKRARSNSIVVR